MSLDVYFYESHKCPHCGKETGHGEEVWSANITHNLNSMAEEAGIYGIVWRPEENGIEKAGDLTERLTAAIDVMNQDPPRFEKHNSKNGWGMYEHFVPWLERLRDASKEYPDARVRASR